VTLQLPFAVTFGGASSNVIYVGVGGYIYFYGLHGGVAYLYPFSGLGGGLYLYQGGKNGVFYR